MTSRPKRAAPLALAAVGLLLAGCFATPNYRPVGFVTPKDPPGLPLRKPAPPADFAAWEAPFETAAALPARVAGAVPAAGAVQVQELPPQGGVVAEPLPPTLAPPTPAPPQPAPAVATSPEPATAPAPLQTAALATQPIPAGGRYVVARGDSLFGIARRFGLPLRAVIDANNLQPPYALSVGQSLEIPSAKVHEVAAGDTVFNIAARYNVDRSELVRMNNIQPPYTIPLGQKLVLPTPGATEVGATEVAYRPPGAKPAPPQRVEASPPAKPARSRAETRAALANLPPRAGSSFLWPVQGPVLSSYGAKKGGEHNDGINIAAPRGTPVRAAENGVVAYAGEELKGFGKLLLVKHDGGWVTAYAHNANLLVQAGDRVKRGQTIAKVGSSGSVSRPQLHFEVRRGTRAVNPETQLAPRTAAVMN